VWRLLWAWRVTPRAAAHNVSILGQRLSYPAANLDAVVIVVLAAVGLVTVAMTVLDAVLAHEAHHVRCHGPLRLAAARVLARALFFVPGLRELVRRQEALAELGADESAINAAASHRSALARAMLMFADSSAPAASVGVDPGRVDHLLGEAPRWRFPTLLCCAAAGVIALLGAIAVLAGHLAVGSATLAPPFFSRQPCVVALALIPRWG
jgi:beta-lactamase regulating signal transducer with metallopeptidase domain